MEKKREENIWSNMAKENGEGIYLSIWEKNIREKEIVTDVGLLVREGGGEGKGDLHTKKQSFPQ